MRNRLAAGLVVGALALTACGGGDGPGATASSPTERPDPAATSPSDGATQAPVATTGPAGPPSADGDPHEALAFQAPLLDGGTFDGAVSGDVVLWFWAPW